STMASRSSSSASSSQPSSCTTMPGLMPSRAAGAALPESTLIPAAPPWLDLLLTGRGEDALPGTGRTSCDITGTATPGARSQAGHDQRDGSPHPGHVTPLVPVVGSPRPAGAGTAGAAHSGPSLGGSVGHARRCA